MLTLIQKDPGFDEKLLRLLRTAQEIPAEVMERADEIFKDVERGGDKSLARWTRELESHEIYPGRTRVTGDEIKRAMDAVGPSDLKVMRLAARRIKAFHQTQKPANTKYNGGDGTVIEERFLPIERVGLCVPGGRFPLASTVLMTAIPARLAGVSKLVMISPWPGGVSSPHVLAAAGIAGVDSVHKVGGVQGVAALASGSSSVPRVDKIVGPGSIWVTAAKVIAHSRGMCGIDSIAGPSEVAVAADAKADAGLIALDMAAQAEHGGDSSAVLVTTSPKLAERVEVELQSVVKTLGAVNEGLKSSAQSIFTVIARDEEGAAEVVNLIAPEHLEIMMESPRRFLARIKNAGSVFMGPYSPAPAGDYMAGANHVLPTGGTARFSSPLGVSDFMKTQTVTTLSKKALESIAGPVERFAEIEGLLAHSLSVSMRFKK